MKLIDLNPIWVGYGGEGVSDASGNPIPHREKVAISFDCPCGCGHPLCVIIANPPDGKGPIYEKPVWTLTGDSFENLTLSPSILRMLGCKWHGFIENGNIRTV